MARTRARGRAGGGARETSVSEHEVAVASSSAREGSAVPSESEDGQEGTRRTSPRKRGASIMNDTTITATESLTLAGGQTSSPAKQRPFRPTRSARKTTQPQSSAAKRRALHAVAARAPFMNDAATTSESEDELLGTSSASRVAVGAPASTFAGGHNDTSDSEEDQMHIGTARLSQGTSAIDRNGMTDEEDDGDETIWVPVRSDSQGGSGSISSLKRKNAPSSSSRYDDSENGTPRPAAGGALSLRQLARQARHILESAMEDNSVHLSSDDKDTLSDFLGSMQPPNREPSSEHDIRIERVLLDTFGLTAKQAGPEFSIVELIDIVTYLLLFSDTDDAEVLRQGLPVAIENFGSSLLPLGLRLNLATLELHLQLRIQLILARARVAGEILEEDNEDIMNDDQDLALRCVDNGQEALWDEYLGRADRIMGTILSGQADIDDLLAEYPYEEFLTAFLKHVRRVLIYLKRPTIRQASTVNSSPSKYHEHIARKRLKADQVRRQSAPPLQVPQMPASPYQDLRGKIKQARKSSPLRRPPPPFLPHTAAGRADITSTLQDSKRDSDSSDNEVENVLLTRSSDPLASEQEEDIEKVQGPEAAPATEEAVDEDASMLVEEEVVTVETQSIETQVVQENLLDRSALGVFLETQAETQADTQTEDGQEQDTGLEEEGVEVHTQTRGDEKRAFWDSDLESAGGNEAAMSSDFDAYVDSGSSLAGEPNTQQAQGDSQASQTVPGRSDAPSPSLENPQSFDDSLYDELLQDADETVEDFEMDTSQAPILGSVQEISAKSAPVALASDAERPVRDHVIASLDTVEDGTADDPLKESLAAPAETTPKTLPRRRGRPPKKKPNWFAKRDDAEKITMSSPAQSSNGSAIKPAGRSTRAARKSTGPLPAVEGNGEIASRADAAEPEASLPPSARAVNQNVLSQSTGPRTRRRAFQYIETEISRPDGSEDTDNAVDVASTRQFAREKAAATTAPKGKGRARQPNDPEQATSRISLPLRKGRTRGAAVQKSYSLPSSDTSEHENGDDDKDEIDLDTPARRLAREIQDEYVDDSSEHREEDDDSAPMASTSTMLRKPSAKAKRRTPRRSAASVSGSVSAASPDKRAVSAGSVSEAKGKGKARATSAAHPSPALKAHSADVKEEDTLNNDPEQLAEKRRLFAEAIKAHREGLEQSERFLDIKRRYNEISLIYPKYVDERAAAVSTWDGSERKTFLVALDLMPNPLANRRFKSVLMDHGMYGIVTRNLKNRKSSQLKDKGENIRALHQNAPISNPAFAFFQNALDIDGTIVRKPQRKRKTMREKSVATDEGDEIEDFHDMSEA